MRAVRRAMPEEERVRASRAICRNVQSLGAYRAAKKVAIYLAFDGEPSLDGLIDDALARRKQVYVPVLDGLAMRFERLDPAAGLARNFFGILEPVDGEPIDPRRLDLVLTPLVAFDSRGVRIGVGRGYYDRCFAFLTRRGQWQRPRLLGVGYEFQHVPVLPHEPWDVPLWGAVTETGVRRFEPRGGTR